MLTGRTTPVRKGATIKLQRKVGSGPWRAVASTKAKAASTATAIKKGTPFTFKVKGVKGKKVQYRVLCSDFRSGRVDAYSPARVIRR
ncbi:MAG: hypothetical protein HZY75_09715 [Nocardioidaceae bacterium]|nr:MAG: hypothetical protein HZY75_09715 [Nocardioidaceae bacterium]